jgi:hypothetical protein
MASPPSILGGRHFESTKMSTLHRISTEHQNDEIKVSKAKAQSASGGFSEVAQASNYDHTSARHGDFDPTKKPRYIGI